MDELTEFYSWVKSNYPNLSKQQVKELDDFVGQKQKEQAIQTYTEAGISPEKIPTSDIANAVLLNQIQQGTYKPSSGEEAGKQELKLQNVQQAVDLLKENLKQAEVSGPILGTLANLANVPTGGGIAPEVADYEALRKSLIGPLARAISGEVGVLTDKDIARAEGLLPKITDSEKLRANKLKNLENMVSKKLGTQTKTNIKQSDPLGLGL